MKKIILPVGLILILSFIISCRKNETINKDLSSYVGTYEVINVSDSNCNDEDDREIYDSIVNYYENGIIVEKNPNVSGLVIDNAIVFPDNEGDFLIVRRLQTDNVFSNIYTSNFTFNEDETIDVSVHVDFIYSCFGVNLTAHKIK